MLVLKMVISIVVVATMVLPTIILMWPIQFSWANFMQCRQDDRAATSSKAACLQAICHTEVDNRAATSSKAACLQAMCRRDVWTEEDLHKAPGLLEAAAEEAKECTGCGCQGKLAGHSRR